MKINSVALLVLVCLFTGCSASFESIKSVAKIGTTFTDYTSLNDEFSLLCSHINSFIVEEAQKKKCDDLAANYKKLNTGMQVLTAYSNALLLGVEEDNFKFSDIVEQTAKAGSTAHFFSISDNEIAGLKAIAGATKAILVTGQKKKALGGTIKSLEGIVDGATNDMIAIVITQQSLLNEFEIQVKNRFAGDVAIRAKLVGSNVDKFGLHNDLQYLLTKYIRDHREKLKTLDKSIKAFQKGHAILAKDSDTIGGKKDPKVLGEILSSLKDIFEGIDKINTPTESTPTSTTN